MVGTCSTITGIYKIPLKIWWVKPNIKKKNCSWHNKDKKYPGGISFLLQLNYVSEIVIEHKNNLNISTL